MIANIFHGVTPEPIAPPGEQGLGILFCNSKQIQICILLFCDGGGSSVVQGVCVARMRDGRGKRDAYVCARAWMTVMDWATHTVFVIKTNSRRTCCGMYELL